MNESEINMIKSERSEINLTTSNLTEDENFRIVQVGKDSFGMKFKSNEVITARYNVLTWIPKSLLMQFTRINNVYFLIMSILSAMPFSPKNPFTLGATFALVLIFTMFKEGYEDIFRHRQDNEANKTLYHKYSFAEKKFVQVESKKIKVADILMISEHESFPADLVMIANSHPKGIAFVNTMNLDGETNLKEKVLVPNLLEIKQECDLDNIKIELQVDQPSLSLVKWNCNILTGNFKEPLNMKQLLLRGCALKNTDWVYGVVVYTGTESKIVMNSKKAPTKSSYIQKKMNWILLSVFIVQIFFCFIYAGVGEQWLKDNNHASYIDLPKPGLITFILRVLTYWVGYSHLIPISLYVALEIVRLILASFIKNDLTMYDEAADKPAKCSASDLIEELGQVEFIFSDKTGTLTSNEMVFRKCRIGKSTFGSDKLAISEDTKLRSKLDKEHKLVKEFFMMLCLCNSVFPTIHEGKLVYQASSPDELALVEAAKSLGYELKERSEGNLYIEVKGVQESWEILVEIPFNSDRKRMSVILRDPNTGEIKLFSKGADTTMLPLIESHNISESKETLYSFAVLGLRTLVLASKTIPEADYDEWYSKWKEIQMSNSVYKEDILEKIARLIENDLNLVGITAIEDKLQEGVPETIKNLMEADIRVWVLTGDKEETAIEIAKSCNLIQSGMKTYEIFTHSKAETSTLLNQVFEDLGLKPEYSFEVLEVLKKNLKPDIAVAINGLALTFVLEDKQLQEKFFKIGFVSKSCICCRVSPSQKMYVVKLSSTFGKWISLAIGDGANDVSMIQEAHIGVGISGKEGSQAVQAAEFSFTQFRYLQPLLFIHGRLAYYRISTFILYYFYKNFLSVFTELWFAIFSGFSGQIFFLDWLPSMYNSFWTSWPCLTFFSIERDITPKHSLEFINLYSAGQKSAYFSIKSFWGWLGFAFLSACWIYWLPIAACYNGIGAEGHEPSLFWVTTVSFILLIHSVNLKLLLVCQFWPRVSLFTIVLSFLLFYSITLILSTVSVSRVFQPEFSGMFFDILGNGKTWIITLIGPILVLIPDFMYKSVQFIYFPNPSQKLQTYFKVADAESSRNKVADLYLPQNN